jgi:hypothetical protein
MNVLYKSSERMDLLTVGRTYIRRHKKIKSKLTSPDENQMNNDILAQGQLSRQENCVENLLGRCLQQFGTPRTDCMRPLI